MSTVHAAVVGFPSPTQILPASDSKLRPRRSSGFHLAYTTNPSGKRQRAPSTPRWGPSSLQRSFRRAIASSVHVFLGERIFFEKIIYVYIYIYKQGDLNSLRTIIIHPCWSTTPRCQFVMLQLTFDFLYLNHKEKKKKKWGKFLAQ